jgi:hypothetical protein
MEDNQPQMTGVLIEDRSGEMHVFIDRLDDDHIVVKYVTNARGECFETTLPYGSWTWERAVARALRAEAFLTS